jgi:hypothetical protein
MFGGNYCRRFEHGACIADRKKAGKFFRSERFGFGCHHPTMPSFVHWNVFKFAQKSENTAISGGLPLPCALAPFAASTARPHSPKSCLYLERYSKWRIGALQGNPSMTRPAQILERQMLEKSGSHGIHADS